MLAISQKCLRTLALLCNIGLASSGKTEYFQDASSLDHFPAFSNPLSPNPLAHSDPRLGSWSSDHVAPHTSEKYLLVHFVVGLAQSYVLENWVHDFSLASTKSIDAFVLNVGNEPWVRPLVDTAFRGALQTPMKLALSLDFSVIPCSSDHDKDVIIEFINSYIGQSCYFRYAGRPLVSTFGGERCTFGKGNSNDGWNVVLDNLSTRVVFVPAFFIYAGAYKGYTGVDGVMDWNAAWPMGNQDISFERDQATISQIGEGLLYLAAISPWFFTHYVNGRNGGKNFVYRSENWLLATRWEEIVQNRDKVDMVEMISWNDYGESHYIGPVTGTQPEWDAWWANGFDHQGWLDLIQYYAVAFKTGVYPRVQKDRIFLWARLLPKDADCSDGKPSGYQSMEDTLYGIVISAMPGVLSTITLTCGRSEHFDMSQGLTKVKMPLRGGPCDVSAEIRRAGIVVMNYKPESFSFNLHPGRCNYNAFVSASS